MIFGECLRTCGLFRRIYESPLVCWTYRENYLGECTRSTGLWLQICGLMRDWRCTFSWTVDSLSSRGLLACRSAAILWPSMSPSPASLNARVIMLSSGSFGVETETDAVWVPSAADFPCSALFFFAKARTNAWKERRIKDKSMRVCMRFLRQTRLAVKHSSKMGSKRGVHKGGP